MREDSVVDIGNTSCGYMHICSYLEDRTVLRVIFELQLLWTPTAGGCAVRRGQVIVRRVLLIKAVLYWYLAIQ